MTGREAAKLGQELGFQKYSEAAHSLADRPEETGVMRVPELAAAMYGADGVNNEKLVLAYIEKNGFITQRLAANKLNVWRLSSVINRLRCSGHQIVTVYRKGQNGGRYAEYHLT